MEISGADLRRQFVEHAGAAGARGRGARRCAVRGRAPVVRPGGRAHRGAGPGADPGRRADVPVQQPGRPAGPAADGERVRRGPGRWRTGGPGGSCWPASCSASRSWPRCSRRSWSCRRSRWPTCGPGRRGCGKRIWQLAAGRGGILVGGGWWVAGRRAGPGGRPAVHRRVDQQQHPAARHRLQRPRPADRQRDRLDRRRGPAGCAAVSGGFGGATGIGRLFSAEFGGQISWLLPAALICLVGHAVGVAAGRRAPTGSGPRLLLWGGWLIVHRGWCSAS